MIELIEGLKEEEGRMTSTFGNHFQTTFVSFVMSRYDMSGNAMTGPFFGNLKKTISKFDRTKFN